MNLNPSSQNYLPRLSKKFEKSLPKIPKNAREKIAEIIAEIHLTGKPPPAKNLVGNLAGLQSIRIGDYRVLICIDTDEKIVEFVDIDHRREVYR